MLLLVGYGDLVIEGCWWLKIGGESFVTTTMVSLSKVSVPVTVFYALLCCRGNKYLNKYHNSRMKKWR